mgnify:CR=1 FL=1
MRIAILSRNPRLYSTSLLVESGQARGHDVDVVVRARADVDGGLGAQQQALQVDGGEDVVLLAEPEQVVGPVQGAFGTARQHLARDDPAIVEVDDGLRHGYFDLAVTCETVNGKKRRLTIKAGKNHRFTIPEDEIE